MYQYMGAIMGVLDVHPSEEATSNLQGCCPFAEHVMKGEAEVGGCTGVTNSNERNISIMSRSRERVLERPNCKVDCRL